MEKAVPTDLEIAHALTRGGSARGAARILGCGRARIRKYIDERMIEVPVTDDGADGPVTDDDRKETASLAAYMADA